MRTIVEERFGVLPAVLLVAGCLSTGMGVALISKLSEGHGADNLFIDVPLALLPIGIGASVIVGSFLLRKDQFSFCVSEESFSVDTKGIWHNRHRSYRLDDLEEVDFAGAILRLVDGEEITLPGPLRRHLESIEALLCLYRDRPPLKSDGDPVTAALEGSLDVEDPMNLRRLIHHYRAAAIFRESLPPVFDLVKILIGLKRSNGGLVLFGVRPDGRIVGLSDDDMERGRARLEHIASDLTTAQVKIGKIELEGKSALFAVFNAVPANTLPLDSFREVTSDVSVV